MENLSIRGSRPRIGLALEHAWDSAAATLSWDAVPEAALITVTKDQEWMALEFLTSCCGVPSDLAWLGKSRRTSVCPRCDRVDHGSSSWDSAEEIDGGRTLQEAIEEWLATAEENPLHTAMVSSLLAKALVELPPLGPQSHARLRYELHCRLMELSTV